MADRTLSLVCAGSDDLRGILFGGGGDDRALHDDFATILSGTTDLEVSRMTTGGWARTIETLRSDPPSDGERFDVLLTSASAELVDPSPNPREALIALSRFATDRSDAHVIALNGSTLHGVDDGADRRPEYETAIRRLNLAILEASNETGLSVLDADRLVAETRSPGKVSGPLSYSPRIQEVLRSSLASILGGLGFAERSSMQVSMPFIRDVAAITIERWFPPEGDAVTPGDAMCQLRLNGVRLLKSPRSATVLAAIGHRPPLLERLVTRERVQRRRLDADATLVAADNGILRKVLRPANASIRPGDVLAILSDVDHGMLDQGLAASPFRAVIRTNNPRLEALL